MGEKYTGDEMMIVLSVPKNAAQIDFTVKFIDENNEIRTCGRTMNVSDIFDARKDYLYLDPTDDAFVTYSLTEKGIEYYEKYLKDKDDDE